MSPLIRLLRLKSAQSLDDYRYLYASTAESKHRSQYLRWIALQLVKLDRITR